MGRPHRARVPTPAQRAVQEASHDWPLVHDTRRSGKVGCPTCGKTGFPGGPWTWPHAEHVACPEPGCGAVVTERGLANHRAMHAAA